MNTKGKKLVVVLGMHRSGTSAIAGLLSHLGSNFGHSLIPAGPDNTKGFYEDSELVELNDEILSKLGISWTSCSDIHWDEEVLQKLDLKFGERSRSLIQRLVSSNTNITGMKDPRISRLLPFWASIFSQVEIQVNIIWVLRKPLAVHQSLHRRNGYNEDVSLALWTRYNLDILKFASKDSLKLVEYDEALNDEMAIATQFSAAYNLSCPDETYREFFDASLRHSKDTFSESARDGGSENPHTIRKLSDDFYACLRNNPDHSIDTSQLERYMVSSASHIDQISQLIDEISINDEISIHEKNLLLEQIAQSQEDANARERELQNTINSLRHEAKNLHQETSELYTKNYRLNTQVEDIFSSRSWKITKIYRVLGRKFHSLTRAPIYIKVYFQFLYSRLFHHISGLASSSRSNQAAVHEVAQGRGNVLNSTLERPNRDLEALPDIDITLVTHNSSEWIEGFFTSLCKQKYPLSKVSLCITDNNSEDDTLDKIQALTAPVSTLFHNITVTKQPNSGFGSGQDYAIGSGSARFILVTNVDLEFTENSILEVVSHAVNDAEEVASWELRQQPYEHPKYYDPVTLKTAWSSHACILIRRDAYESVGGYEKRIFMYGEDVEISYRFRRDGYCLKYVPSAVVNHYSYEDESSFKPIQFYGSTLANAYIRLRYGNFGDILGIIGLYAGLYFKGGPPEISRGSILKNIGKILVNAPYFLLSRRKPRRPAYFPFRKWDYEMVREGSFYTPPHTDTARPKVSIVTRTYPGREKWLHEAISSVLNQTYDKIELIIVEDGGDTQKELAERCRTLFTGECSIRYSAQPKKGRSYNGNSGLEATSGDYIMFLDDDDLLFHDHVEILARELMANEEISASYALSWEVATIHLKDQKDLYMEQMHSIPDLLRQEFDREVLSKYNYLPIQSVLFRRTLLEHYGGFDVGMSQLEDWDLWFRYSSESDFKYIPKVTSIYRTPYNASERASRHQLLHENYEFAKGKQINFLRSLPIMKSTPDDLSTRKTTGSSF
jgi:GT2 family glycosyltransferase